MIGYKNLLSNFLFAALVLPFTSIGHAQVTATLGAETIKVYVSDGHYEYNSDGVPLIGIIAQTSGNKRVKFTTCNNLSFELNFEQLKPSKAKCPTGKKDPGVWTVAANRIAPIFKVGDNPLPTKVNFDGKIQFMELPDKYRQSISRTESGSLIGYAFKDDDGNKSLVIFK